MAGLVTFTTLKIDLSGFFFVIDASSCVAETAGAVTAAALTDAAAPGEVL